MFYVYLLQSISFPEKRYVGYTVDVFERLKKHNSGGSVYTTTHKPWKLVMYMAFENGDTALEFEKYLKSGSGRAFARKRLWNKQ
jgi:putative endonuclease